MLWPPSFLASKCLMPLQGLPGKGSGMRSGQPAPAADARLPAPVHQDEATSSHAAAQSHLRAPVMKSPMLLSRQVSGFHAHSLSSVQLNHTPEEQPHGICDVCPLLCTKHTRS